MNRLCLLLAALILTGCGDGRIKYAQESVRILLNDPDSAVFKDDRVVERQGKKFAVCGSVNAKNRMGGYVGFKQYVFDGLDVLMLTEENADKFLDTYFEICDRHG